MSDTNHSNIVLVNNTGADISDFTSIFTNAIITKSAIPEEISDLFTLNIIEVGDQTRGILDFA